MGCQLMVGVRFKAHVYTSKPTYMNLKRRPCHTVNLRVPDEQPLALPAWAPLRGGVVVGQQVIMLPPPALQGAGRLLQVPVLLQLPASSALQVSQQQHLLWGIRLQAHGGGQGGVDVTHRACSTMGMLNGIVVASDVGCRSMLLSSDRGCGSCEEPHMSVMTGKRLHNICFPACSTCTLKVIWCQNH